jgi:hypothetical protein
LDWPSIYAVADRFITVALINGETSARTAPIIYALFITALRNPFFKDKIILFPDFTGFYKINHILSLFWLLPSLLYTMKKPNKRCILPLIHTEKRYGGAVGKTR